MFHLNSKEKYRLKTKVINSREYLFDELRKKWILNSPEEKVRQYFWKYLHYEKKYPKSLIAIEKKIIVNQLTKRVDILVYGSNGKPNIIVECKSSNLKISEKTMHQILNYQSSLQANLLVLTNGLDTYCLNIDYKNNKSNFLNSIPEYS
ncbi:MAG: restriction endonuclease subunit R [Crocinitomicaceae bacterium]|nr:restriction endonuclease subunit R [Crocinitomicaceae bacterium]